jgi:hypothetical protein
MNELQNYEKKMFAGRIGYFSRTVNPVRKGLNEFCINFVVVNLLIYNSAKCEFYSIPV